MPTRKSRLLDFINNEITEDNILLLKENIPGLLKSSNHVVNMEKNDIYTFIDEEYDNSLKNKENVTIKS
jgi:hypothetical protein